VNPVDVIYRYRGLHGCHCKCGLRITALADGRVAVICTELPDNPGTSVTNYAEQLATLVCAERGIAPEKLVWIEHYQAHKHHRKPDWDLVTFKVACRQGPAVLFDEPDWRPMRPEDWRQLGLPDPNLEKN